ncbi:M14 family zinc carboxypeptidase [Robiginitalea marina]|uniref:Peptidase M14 n=1 Tax=Robiginitalea marina TaxID=2954105 RepID=A0ABT1AUA2_9FLAO|nr:M14 family zinc carboxypeptidase [Robiginitalea marina]MCO5723595.1 peptidase M14 [Robiginitalea marina]
MEGLHPYQKIKVQEITGRYLPYRTVLEFLSAGFPGPQKVHLGASVNGQPLYGVRLGRGAIRVLLWSQMHGNETTTTRAVLDLLRWLGKGEEEGASLLDALQLFFIPVLNPDGAGAYTRFNANQVDLNRDAQSQSQPESRILRQVYEDFTPHYCFNLHDQRTIFGVGQNPVPATLSFLAPAASEQRDFTPGRHKAARLIGRIAGALGHGIGVGRYDDTFNPNCVGDYFQARGTPTLLFEAGHFPGDYEREITRYHVFRALQIALLAIRDKTHEGLSLEPYLGIPENRECFVDVLVRNAHALGKGQPKGSLLGVQYEEVLQDNRIRFVPRCLPPGQLASKWGHRQFDAENPEDFSALKADAALYAILQGK